MAYALETNGDVLNEIRRRIVSAVQPEKLYLFGSRAWGPASSESDYDFLIVLPDGSPGSHREAKLSIRRALRGLGISADLIVERASEFAERAAASASLEALIAKRGVAIHE